MRSTYYEKEDVVQASLGELILFLLFFFLILLATYLASETAAGQQKATEIADLKAQLSLLGEQQEQSMKSLSITERELDAAELQSDIQGSALAELRAHAANLETENQVLSSDLADEQAIAADLKAEVSRLLKELEDSLQSLASERNSIELNTSEKRQQNTDLEDRNRIQMEMSELEITLGEEKSKSQELAAEIEKLSRQLELLRIQNEVATNVATIGGRSLERSKRREERLTSENSDLQGIVSERDLLIDEQNIELDKLRSDIITANEIIARLSKNKAENDWPANLKLSDNDGYRFESGSYIPTQEFKDNFYSVGIKEVFTVLAEFGDEIAVVEVIGHTDEQFYRPRASPNLDERLIDFLEFGRAIDIDNWVELGPADNAGLGLARAAAISILIKEEISQTYPQIRVIPYSAGQLIETNSNLDRVARSPVRNTPNRARRRIEVRFSGR